MELSTTQAAQMIGVSQRTIRNYVELGLLPGRKEGLKRRIRIQAEDLRKFAERYQFEFNEEKFDES